MKTVTYILDDQWAKVVSGEMSIEDWKAQAKTEEKIMKTVTYPALVRKLNFKNMESPCHHEPTEENPLGQSCLSTFMNDIFKIVDELPVEEQWRAMYQYLTEGKIGKQETQMQTPQAVIDELGTIRYYKPGTKILHRENGPAVECTNGDKYWYLNGKRYRENGPAVERGNGDKGWYLNGKKVTEEEWRKQVGK